jgi:hypothetical protein
MGGGLHSSIYKSLSFTLFCLHFTFLWDVKSVRGRNIMNSFFIDRESAYMYVWQSFYAFVSAFPWGMNCIEARCIINSFVIDRERLV